jgi:ubiquinone/menaquinone biosynthesis C-methylase UbiE
LGAQVWGIDSSPTAIAEAKAFAQSHSVSDRTHFTVGDALDLPFEDNFFDAIVDRGLFHHILPANRVVYREGIKRVSRRGSIFYLIVFSRKSPVGIGQRFTKRGIEKLFGDVFTILVSAVDPFPVSAPAHLLYFILKR